jgi:hypothetical protein
MFAFDGSNFLRAAHVPNGKKWGLQEFSGLHRPTL